MIAGRRYGRIAPRICRGSLTDDGESRASRAGAPFGQAMTAIAERYILRETVQVWLAVTGVLMVILVTNQFAKVLGDAATNKIPRDALLLVMGLTSVQYLTILVPVGLFLAILLALGRLYRDSEMYALMACGVGPARLYRPVLAFALVLAAIVGWLALDVSPAAIREVRRIGQEARARADLQVMEAGRFVKFGQAGAVVYAEEVDAAGHLHRVFVQRRRDNLTEVIVAAEAYQRDTADPDVKMLVFTNGRRYEGEPGTARFRIIDFAEHGIPYSLPGQVPVNYGPKGRSVAALLESGSLADLAELQWRVSVPLMVLVLAFLAVPLGRSSPRQGRYAGLVIGLLIYISYSNLLGSCRVWVERGKVPVLLGLWWVHGLFIAAALVLLATRYGSGLARFWRRRAVRPA